MFLIKEAFLVLKVLYFRVSLLSIGNPNMLGVKGDWGVWGLGFEFDILVVLAFWTETADFFTDTD